MNTTGEPLDALMGALGSLGDPTRLRLLRLLERRELGVADLVSALQLPQSTVSRHLKILSDQGWVRNRAEGTNRIYRMPAPEDTVAKKLWHVAKDRSSFRSSTREGGPLPGVLVSIDGPGVANRSRRSDKEGWVSLDVPRPGPYDARLELPGSRAGKVERINVAAKCQVKLLVAMKVSARETVVQ